MLIKITITLIIFQAKVAVCSFHFKDGQPTAENPYPSQLLGAGFGPQYFCGKPPKIEVTQESMSQVFKIIILVNK